MVWLSFHQPEKGLRDTLADKYVGRVSPFHLSTSKPCAATSVPDAPSESISASCTGTKHGELLHIIVINDNRAAQVLKILPLGMG